MPMVRTSPVPPGRPALRVRTPEPNGSSGPPTRPPWRRGGQRDRPLPRRSSHRCHLRRHQVKDEHVAFVGGIDEAERCRIAPPVADDPRRLADRRQQLDRPRSVPVRGGVAEVDEIRHGVDRPEPGGRTRPPATAVPRPPLQALGRSRPRARRGRPGHLGTNASRSRSCPARSHLRSGGEGGVQGVGVVVEHGCPAYRWRLGEDAAGVGCSRARTARGRDDPPSSHQADRCSDRRRRGTLVGKFTPALDAVGTEIVGARRRASICCSTSIRALMVGHA